MFKKILAILLFTLLAYVCVSCEDQQDYMEELFDEYPQDNIFEEMLEEIIENKIGLDIDLSPSSPEE